jgi:putative ABC transport system permease protein
MVDKKMPDWSAYVREHLQLRGFRPERESEIVEEIAQQLDEAYQEALRAGGSDQEARAAAERHVADWAVLRQQLASSQREKETRAAIALGQGQERDPQQRGRFSPRTEIRQNLLYALRVLRKSPSFTAIAVLSLALGTGANTAIFQLIDSLRLRTLPVSNPQQLADVRIADTSWRHGRVHGRYPDITNAQWEQIRDHQRVFSNMLAWATEGGFNLAPSGEARYASGIWVSGDFFKTLEVPALRGRTLTADDDRRGCGSPPAVISYAFWRREYAGRPDIVGRMISLDGHQFEIVGITPPSFTGIDVGREFDVAVPLCSEPLMHGESSLIDLRNGYWLAAVGRLKPGVTIEQANAEMAALTPGILEPTVPPQYDAEAQKHYLQYKFGAFPAASGFSNLRRSYETPLWTLLAIAALVLLIACANIANLLLARANARGREIAVRLSLGASRGRLIRQLFVESLLLGVAGTFLGAVLAQWISRFLVAFIGTSTPDVFVDLHPDWLVLGFTMAVALLTTILFGMAPAFRATSIAPAAALKSAGRNLAGGREHFSLRRSLVVSQVAFSLVLLVGAILFVRSLKNILSVNAGFQTAGILEADLDFGQLKIPVPQRQTYKLNLIDRLRALPGVEGVADASVVPLSGFGWSNNVILAGAIKRADVNSQFTRVSPDFFNTMGIPITAGRAFNERDTANSPKVAIVNQSFVKKILNGGNPIGAHFQIEEEVGRARPIYEVVGLVRDTKYYDLRDEFAPEVYVTTAQDDQPDEGAGLLIRSSLPMGTLAQELKNALAEASPEIGTEFHVMQADIQNSLLRERLMAMLSGFFGALATLLAMMGLFGVMSNSVARRTGEIGLRIALGAQRRNILGMVLGEAGAMLVIGLAVGAALALALGKTAGTMLFGLKPYDPLTISLSAIALAAVAILSSYLPAHRAARLDPMAALRDE